MKTLRGIYEALALTIYSGMDKFGVARRIVSYRLREWWDNR